MSRAEQLAGSGAATAFRTLEHQSPERSRHGSNVFSLFHVLQNQVPRIVEKHANTPFWKRETLIRKDLAQLLYTDYVSFLREELGFSLYANVLDIHIDGQGNILANDVRYADSGLAEQCARAARKALEEGDLERAARYQLEEQQTLALLSLAEQEFTLLKNTFPQAFISLINQLDQSQEKTSTLPSNSWQRVDQHELPQAMQERLALFSTQKEVTILRGPALQYTLPQSKIYPRGDAFWGRWTLWATQQQSADPQFFVINEQYMNTHSAQTHSQAGHFSTSHEWLGKDDESVISESSLMQQVSVVHPDLAVLAFPEYVRALTSKVRAEADLVQILGKQQAMQGTFLERKHLAWQASEAMADVLLQEFRLGIQPDTEDVLNVINEAPMHSLVSGGKFSMKGIHQGYQKLNEYRSQTGNLSDSGGLRTTFMSSILKEMPQLQFSVLSKVDCAVGSFGGFSNLEQALRSSGALSAGLPSFGTNSEALSYFRSQNFTREQLTALIGKDRAKEWHIGVCVGCGASTMVGECSLCYACELQSEQSALSSFSENFSSDTNRDGTYGKVPSDEFVQPQSNERTSVGQFLFALVSAQQIT